MHAVRHINNLLPGAIFLADFLEQQKLSAREKYNYVTNKTTLTVDPG